jgi:hypothetical protein
LNEKTDANLGAQINQAVDNRDSHAENLMQSDQSIRNMLILNTSGNNSALQMLVNSVNQNKDNGGESLGM